MKAMVLHSQSAIESSPLKAADLPRPRPGYKEVLIKVACCAVCRTDLHVIEGDLAAKTLPLIPGHQVVGLVEELGPECNIYEKNQWVGVAWLGESCGHCIYCVEEKENLCLQPHFTGYEFQGGYADYIVAKEDFIYSLPDNCDKIKTAPLLCAGIVGYRAFKRSQVKAGQHLLLLGLGSSAHIILQLARSMDVSVSVVTRAQKHQELAKKLGAIWSGDDITKLPQPADSVILFAPAGDLVPKGLMALKRGGTLAVAGIHLSPIPTLDYQMHLFNERDLRSVTANTRKDGEELLSLAAQFHIHPETVTYDLLRANEALTDLKQDRINGTAVLIVNWDLL